MPRILLVLLFALLSQSAFAETAFTEHRLAAGETVSSLVLKLTGKAGNWHSAKVTVLHRSSEKLYQKTGWVMRRLPIGTRVRIASDILRTAAPASLYKAPAKLSAGLNSPSAAPARSFSVQPVSFNTTLSASPRSESAKPAASKPFKPAIRTVNAMAKDAPNNNSAVLWSSLIVLVAAGLAFWLAARRLPGKLPRSCFRSGKPETFPLMIAPGSPPEERTVVLPQLDTPWPPPSPPFELAEELAEVDRALAGSNISRSGPLFLPSDAVPDSAFAINF